ncbi:MAG: AI-2E family transporter [Bacteroidota bacterium]
MRVSFRDLFYTLAFFIAFIAVLFLARGILVPVTFAFLFAFILFPVMKWLTHRNVGKTLAIVSTMIGVSVLSTGVLVLFSTRIVAIAGEYTSFLSKLKSIWTSLLKFLNERVQIIPDLKSKDLLDQLSDFFSDSSFVIISDTIGVTSTFVSYLVLSLIYTFFILFYHDHLVKGIALMTKKDDRNKFIKMLKEVQQVGQKYFTGMLSLIVILGLMLSIGLLIIGIDYPFFFGFFAAILAIIPYLGTILGGLIPTIYALVNYDSYWYPVAVIGVFWLVQFLEGNFLSPKIVGGSMQINALASIVALIAGGALWGLPGMVLFLPMTAMVRVVCEHYDNLEPIAVLLGDTNESKRQPNLLGGIYGFVKSKFKK